MGESSEKVHSVIMLAQIKGSGVTWIKAHIVYEWSSVYRLWIRPESSIWIKIICIMLDRLGEGSPLVWGGVLSGLSRGQPKRCYIEYQVLLYIRIQWILVWFRTTSSQHTRMKNRRLRALLRRSCSGIQNRRRETAGILCVNGRMIGIQRENRRHSLCLQRSERDSVEDCKY